MHTNNPNSGFSLANLLDWTQGKIANGKLEERKVSGLAGLSRSEPKDVAFFHSRAFEQELESANAGVLIISQAMLPHLMKHRLWEKSAVIIAPDPYFSLAILSEKFAPLVSTVAHLNPPEEKRIHPTALLHSSVVLGEGVDIGPYCVLEEGVSVGAGSVLYPHCTLGPSVSLGERCVLFPNVQIYERVRIGNRARLHSGVVLGSDGFGYAAKLDGKRPVGHQKIYHLGSIVIGDDVEIGANSCVDRGTFDDTVIANSVKLDNNVHVGHNSRVEDGAVLCGGVTLAGHTHIGRYVYVGGLTGVSNHVYIKDYAKVGACSLITKDVAPGEIAVGNPQRSYREHFQVHAILNMMREKRRSL